MNSEAIKEFFTEDVIARNGFILSADTLNDAHLGPKLMPFVKALHPGEYDGWAEYWAGHVWGEDAESDADACGYLYDVLESVTDWACSNVEGMATNSEVYQFGFSEYDGALLGWFKYPIED